MSFGMSGRIFHAPFLDASPRFRLQAVAERSKKIASSLYPGIISYNSTEELLNDTDIELLVVNTPNNTHFDYCKAALESGKHVLVEKPVCTSSKEVRELFRLAASKQLNLMVYQNRRWDADYRLVSKVVSEGSLGQLIEAHFRFDRYKKALSVKAFKEEPMPASGLIYDLGPHIIDQVIALFGRPSSFRKTEGTYRPGSKVNDYFHLHLKYPGGLNVYITSGLLMAAGQPAYVVSGVDGALVKPRTDVQEDQLSRGMNLTDRQFGQEEQGGEGYIVRYQEDGKKQLQYQPSLKGNYMHLFDAVYDTIRNNRPFPVTEDEIVCQLEIIEE